MAATMQGELMIMTVDLGKFPICFGLFSKDRELLIQFMFIKMIMHMIWPFSFV
jgi:hypothetical protein